MKDVLNYIRAQSEKNVDTPIFTYLHDEGISIRERLESVSLCWVYFAMSFGDLNSMHYPYPEEEARGNRFKEAINKNAAEDSTHWEYYIQDLDALGFGAGQMNAQHVFRDLIWSDFMRPQRAMVARLTELANQYDHPFIRFTMMECIEIYAYYMFQQTATLADRLEGQEGVKLTFFGGLHLQLEHEHLVHEGQEDIWAAPIEDQLIKQTCLAVAREVCPMVEAMQAAIGHKCLEAPGGKNGFVARSVSATDTFNGPCLQ